MTTSPLSINELPHVPISRFRRELNKWLRRGQVVAITRNGKVLGVLVPHETYMENLARLNTDTTLAS